MYNVIVFWALKRHHQVRGGIPTWSQNGKYIIWHLDTDEKTFDLFNEKGKSSDQAAAAVTSCEKC